MRVRSVFVAGLVLSLIASGLAGAAPRPKPRPQPRLCNVLTDPRGDNPSVQPSGGTGPTYDPNLDILSADLANNATMVTAVIRLARLDANDSMAPSGRFYKLSWTYASSGIGQHLSAQMLPTGTIYSPKGASGSIDLAKAEIHISMPIGDLVGHPTFAKGDSAQLGATSDPGIPSNPAFDLDTGIPGNGALGDDSNSAKPYPLYAPSCVTPGR